jgi:hypothetical protein
MNETSHRAATKLDILFSLKLLIDELSCSSIPWVKQGMYVTREISCNGINLATKSVHSLLLPLL